MAINVITSLGKSSFTSYGVHRSSAIKDITHLVCSLTYHDHVIKESHDVISVSSSVFAIKPLSLLATDNAVVEI